MTLYQYKEQIENLMVKHGRDIELIVFKKELDDSMHPINFNLMEADYHSDESEDDCLTLII